jgi:hypothetical protein
MPNLAAAADRAEVALQAYQAAHLAMATAATTVVDSVIGDTFTIAEALSYLALHVARYRDELAAIDHGMAST